MGKDIKTWHQCKVFYVYETCTSPKPSACTENVSEQLTGRPCWSHHTAIDVETADRRVSGTEFLIRTNTFQWKIPQNLKIPRAWPTKIIVCIIATPCTCGITEHWSENSVKPALPGRLDSSVGVSADSDGLTAKQLSEKNLTVAICVPLRACLSGICSQKYVHQQCIQPTMSMNERKRVYLPIWGKDTPQDSTNTQQDGRTSVPRIPRASKRPSPNPPKQTRNMLQNRTKWPKVLNNLYQVTNIQLTMITTQNFHF